MSAVGPKRPSHGGRMAARCSKKTATRRFQVSGHMEFFLQQGSYFSWVEMLSNLAFRVVPIAFTVAIITTEMPAAIRPYSIAVAPESSFRNATTLDIKETPWLNTAVKLRSTF